MWIDLDQTLWKVAILMAYFLTLLLLSFYGSHRYLMVYLYRKYGGGDPTPKARFEDALLPIVTIQLPLFNERYVVERLIEATCQIDYPLDRLEIQILDDSTDDTTALALELAERFRAQGIDIKVLHRTDRTGYKAGALQAGMAVARGELIAVFDADFVPQPEFLRLTIDHFTDPKVGMVQARWGYINRDYSLLTRAQAVLLDGHFVLEHTARNRSGRFFNFNGTAGMWRRTAIEEAGGWEHHTLTEDLDLSYRAQLKGWQFIFLRDVVVPSEIPVEMNAFKAQQHRWAKGSLQTAIKLLPRVLKSPLPFKVKLEAFHHLTGNLAYLLLVVLAVLMPLATLVRIQHGWYEVMILDLPIFISATFSVCYFYWVSQREIGRDRLEIVRLIPAVLGIGIGVSLNNAKAVVEALVGYKTPFVRTPKYAIERRGGESWTSKLYIRKTTLMPLLEFALGLWFSYAIWTVFVDGRYNLYSLPFLMLFQFGFFYVASLSVTQSLMTRSSAQPN
ncbi:MAG: glycosyltransferase [Bradymonadaceae bacterium]|nr:glycosyltransferase [Lujinxingiaceae bacterium]